MSWNARETCPRCGSAYSRHNRNRHAGSAACRDEQAVNAAVRDLAEVGGYVRIVRAPVVSLVGRRRVRVRAAGIGEIGDLTIVDGAGGVRQYLDGEWTMASDVQGRPS